jgi:hypothetical protein
MKALLLRWARLQIAKFAGRRAAAAWERFEFWDLLGRRWRQ